MLEQLHLTLLSPSPLLLRDSATLFANSCQHLFLSAEAKADSGWQPRRQTEARLLSMHRHVVVQVCVRAPRGVDAGGAVKRSASVWAAAVMISASFSCRLMKPFYSHGERVFWQFHRFLPLTKASPSK